MAVQAQKITFQGSSGGDLAARLELPDGPVRAYAVFAHCFTCSKDVFAASRIAGALAEHGIAVLRFDFTGLGASDGEFANTNFSSNVADLVKATDFLRDNYEAPKILIGHSLGGAAVLAAAGDVPEARAVATIGAPAEAAHVIHNFGAKIDEISEHGEAEVSLAGRSFTIRKQFLEDLEKQRLEDRIASLKKALIVFHSPRDATVGIENAGAIFAAAKHPKSFVSLDDADHLLSRRTDAIYVASVLSAWATRYIDDVQDKETEAALGPGVTEVTETGHGKFQQQIRVGRHRLLADEPESYGGLDSGPSPYDYLATALGACTTMTMRMYAERKGFDVDRLSVEVSHAKVHAEDCVECGEHREGRIDRFDRVITIDGAVDEDTRQRLRAIADKCPVHKTLEAGSAVVTTLSGKT